MWEKELQPTIARTGGEDVILNIPSGDSDTQKDGPPAEGNIRGDEEDIEHLTQKWEDILRAGQHFEDGKILK